MLREGFVAPIFELPLFSLLPLFPFPLLPVEVGLFVSGVILILTVGASATAFTSIVVVYSLLKFPFPSPAWNSKLPFSSLFTVGSNTTFPAAISARLIIWSFEISTFVSSVTIVLFPSLSIIVSPLVTVK